MELELLISHYENTEPRNHSSVLRIYCSRNSKKMKIAIQYDLLHRRSDIRESLYFFNKYKSEQSFTRIHSQKSTK